MPNITTYTKLRLCLHLLASIVLQSTAVKRPSSALDAGERNNADKSTLVKLSRKHDCYMIIINIIVITSIVITIMMKWI